MAPADPAIERSFIGGTGDYSASLLKRSHPKYAGVKEQFTASWRKPGPRPLVQRVFQIRNPPEIYARYCNYLRATGNEQRRFHGTALKCEFGHRLNQPPCSEAACGVCNICAKSFQMACVRTGGAVGWSGRLRFGPGLYFSATSGKSNDYADASGRDHGNAGQWRCMFLCRVALGKSWETQADQKDMVQPPPGFDSVEGVVGEDLNYDEVVVYNEHAAIPSYLIVYMLR